MDGDVNDEDVTGRCDDDDGWGRSVVGPKARMAGRNDAGLVERATPKTRKPETRARKRLTVLHSPRAPSR